MGDGLERESRDEGAVPQGLGKRGLDDERVVPTEWDLAANRLCLGAALRNGRGGRTGGAQPRAKTPSPRDCRAGERTSARAPAAASDLGSEEAPGGLGDQCG